MEVGVGELKCLTAGGFGFGASLYPWAYRDSLVPLTLVMPYFLLSHQVPASC